MKRPTMSGRGNNRRGGRGGRGRGGRGDANNRTNKPKVKTIDDCVFHLGGATQASDFKGNSEILINYIRTNYKADPARIIKALEELEETEVKPPTLRSSFSRR